MNTAKLISGVAVKSAAAPLPPVVNWHLTKQCNYSCSFCFATFGEFDHKDSIADRDLILLIPRQLKEAGADKITFVGGEPFLHPLIDALIVEAKESGLVTSAVTNGSLLTPERLTLLAPHLDWLAFSIDSSSDSIHSEIGRGLSHELSRNAVHSKIKINKHNERILDLWPIARSLGIKLKLNTVQTDFG